VARFVRWAFITQAIIIDGKDVETALNQSSDVVKGHWWRTAGRLVAIKICAEVATFVFILVVIASEPGLLVQAINVVITMITGPYFAIGATLAYFDLKTRKAEEVPA
jgi:hypothetical protein